MPEIALSLLVTMLPMTELRGGIPLGLLQGYDPKWFVPLCILLNSLVYLPYRLLLDKGLSRVKFIAKQIDKVKERGQKYIDKYGFWGMVLFVGTPLPFTGVYTGTLVSWAFKLDFKKTYLAMLLGCVMAGSIIAGLYIATGFIMFKFQ